MTTVMMKHRRTEKAVNSRSKILLGILIGTTVATGILGDRALSEKVRSEPSIHGNSSNRSLSAFSPSIQAMVVTEEGVVYAGSFGMGVFRSEDKGQSWESVNAGLTDHFLLCLEIGHDGRVYAGTVRGGVFRSKESGKHWEVINKGLKQVEVKSLLAIDKEVYAGTGRGVYHWVESEIRWVPLAKELDQVLVAGLAMLDDRILLAATAGKGLFRFDTEATQYSEWEGTSSDLVDPKERLPHRYLRVVAVNKEQHILLGTQDGGLFRSTDHGGSWHSISRTLPNDSIRSIVPHKSELFVATGRGVFKMGDSGGRWNSVNDGLTELAIQVLVVSHHGTFYAGTSSGAFRSDDNGIHWINVSDGFGLHTSQPQPYR